MGGMPIPTMNATTAGAITLMISVGIYHYYVMKRRLHKQAFCAEMQVLDWFLSQCFPSGAHEHADVFEPAFLCRTQDHDHDRMTETGIKYHCEVTAGEIRVACLAPDEPGNLSQSFVRIHGRVLDAVFRSEEHAIACGAVEHCGFCKCEIAQEKRDIVRGSVCTRHRRALIEAGRIQEKIGRAHV